ncbi:MAG: THUMP domain-containing protein [Chloroflexota bacterium]
MPLQGTAVVLERGLKPTLRIRHSSFVTRRSKSGESPSTGYNTRMNTITLIATARFGLEAVVKREVQALGFEDVRVSEGRVMFTATPADIPRANLWLRCAGRVLLVIGEFTAISFDELYEQTRALPWEDWIPPDGRFPVNARTVHSTLQSERSCQAIVKKAVAERLAAAHGVDELPETGGEYGILGITSQGSAPR